MSTGTSARIRTRILGSKSRNPKEHHRETLEPVWAFYQEWSTLARAVIKDRRQLTLLGLWKPKAKPESA